MFHVGQLVVCVDDTPSPFAIDDPRRGSKILENGRIYTIRGVGPARLWIHHITLKEYIGPPVWLEEVMRDTADHPFGVIRFRPVAKTSIDVFTRMLEPA